MQKPICGTLKTDGFGAQYWSNMTCFAHCRKYNSIYRHFDYIRISHYKENIDAKAMNTFTGLHSDLDDDVTREVDVKRAGTFPCSSNNDAFFTPSVIEELRRMYYSTPKPVPIVCDVAIHIRRGDVSENGKHSGRFRPLSYYKNIVKIIRKQHPDYKIVIFSEGERSDFDEMECDDNIELNLNGNLLETFHTMVESKIFVMGYSCLSLCAAILNKNTIYYMKNIVRPLEHWIYIEEIQRDFKA